MGRISVWPVSPELSARLQAFLASDLHRQGHGAMSAFWQAQTARMSARLGAGTVEITSGFPIAGPGQPPAPWSWASWSERRRALKAFRRLTRRIDCPALDLETLGRVPALAEQVKRAPLLTLNYANLINILGPHVQARGIRQVLEVGSGPAYLSLALHQLYGTRSVMVDLPEMLPLACAVLSHYHPGARVVLPHEVNGHLGGPVEADFVLLTPSQAGLLRDGFADLAINTASFQEMTYPVIAGYFELFYRCLREGGLLYCMNETVCRKIPAAPIEFERFPWNRAFRNLIDDEYAYQRLIHGAPCRQRLQVVAR